MRTPEPTEPLTAHQRHRARLMGSDIARAASWNGRQLNAHQTFTDIEEIITRVAEGEPAAYTALAVTYAREWWSDAGFRMSADRPRDRVDRILLELHEVGIRTGKDYDAELLDHSNHEYEPEMCLVFRAADRRGR